MRPLSSRGALYLPAMASISSATGSLLKSPALFHGGRSSPNTICRRPRSVHFPLDSEPSSPSSSSSSSSSSSGDGNGGGSSTLVCDRRAVVFSSFGMLAGALFNVSHDALAAPSNFADMPALRGKDYGKTKMKYPDYTETESGLQYKDLRMGEGSSPKVGDTVVVDWDGYTIGYYGRIFEARNKTKGGSFETSPMSPFLRCLPVPGLQTGVVTPGDDKDFFKFRLGSQEVIQAFEEAVSGMTLGGIRRIIVPPELGYPENDYNKRGPRPTTFSGQRALDFVLRNQGLIDKTLLFDIELLKIIPNSSV